VEITFSRRRCIGSEVLAPTLNQYFTLSALKLIFFCFGKSMRISPVGVVGCRGIGSYTPSTSNGCFCLAVLPRQFHPNHHQGGGEGRGHTSLRSPRYGTEVHVSSQADGMLTESGLPCLETERLKKFWTKISILSAHHHHGAKLGESAGKPFSLSTVLTVVDAVPVQGTAGCGARVNRHRDNASSEGDYPGGEYPRVRKVARTTYSSNLACGVQNTRSYCPKGRVTDGSEYV
jgi:hypothetical protein